MHDAILRYPDVAKITGLSRTTLWRKEREGTFPKRYRLSTNAVGWKSLEVQEWVTTRPVALTTDKVGDQQ